MGQLILLFQKVKKNFQITFIRGLKPIFEEKNIKPK